MINATIPELPGVTEALSRIPGKLGDALRNASAQARRLLTEQLTAYPAPPPGSRYVRTEQLKRGWERASPVVGGHGFQLINPVAHAGLVQGDRQAGVHKGRWKPASAIAHELEEAVMDLFEQATKEALE
jgi:hypothetical protein